MIWPLVLLALAATGVPARAAPAAVAAQPGVRFHELWVLDQVRFTLPAGEKGKALTAALGPLHSNDAVAALLTRMQIVFNRRRAFLRNDALPDDLRGRIARLPATEPFVLSSSDPTMMVNVIVQRRKLNDNGEPLDLGPGARAAADRILSLTRASETYDSMLSQTVAILLPTILPGNDAKAEEVRRIVGEEFASSFAKYKPLVVSHTRALYLSYFSAEELEQLADLYASPLGSGLLAAGGAISMELLQFGQRLGRAAAQEAMPRIIDRMRAGAMKLPQGV